MSGHSEDPRRTVRIGFETEVGIRRAAEAYRLAVLNDLSSHGCSLDLVATVSLDETVWIKLPGLEARQGLVCWVSEYCCGIEFDLPLHQAVFDLLIAKLEASRPRE